MCNFLTTFFHFCNNASTPSNLTRPYRIVATVVPCSFSTTHSRQLLEPSELLRSAGYLLVSPNMASAGPLDAHSVIAKVKTLINAHLRAVLKGEGLAVSGVKAAMQERIISRKSHPHYISFVYQPAPFPLCPIAISKNIV